LNPAIECHGGPLELFGREQSVGQVDKEAGGDDAGEPIVEDHGVPPRAGRRQRRRRSTARKSRGQEPEGSGPTCQRSIAIQEYLSLTTLNPDQCDDADMAKSFLVLW
jgi:hypothetical protein